MTHTLWPRAHDRTEIVCELHFHPAEMAKPGFHGDDAVGVLGPDQSGRLVDRGAVAGGDQLARVQPGPYSEREELLWSFDEIVKREAEQHTPRRHEDTKNTKP